MSDGGPVLRSPVRGEWVCLRPPGHPRHAFDLVGAVDGRVTRSTLPRLLAGRVAADDCHGWDRPVLSPCEGQVAIAHDGERDHHRIVPLVDAIETFVVHPLTYQHDRRPERMAGNHVLVEVPSGFVLLAHLRQGSVQVQAGQRVRAGQQLGRVGNSGDSMLPHLHVQVMTSPDPADAAVLPFVLEAYELEDGGTWRRREARPLPERRARLRFS